MTACCTSKLLVLNYTSPSAITTFSYGAKSSGVQCGVFNIDAFFEKMPQRPKANVYSELLDFSLINVNKISRLY